MSAALRVDVGGHRLHVEASGAGERHFTCLHGLVDTVDVWKKLVPALEARGRVTRIDQRGHGRSDAPPGPYTRSALARDVVAVLDAMEVRGTIAVGHSMGGVVAMEVALACPARVAGLVLIGTTSECREKVAGWYERIALSGEQHGVDGLRRAIYGEDAKKEITGDPQGIAHVTRMLKSLETDPLTPMLSKIACPVLLAVGADDPMGPRASEIIHRALPDGRGTLVRVPDRGHWLQLDATDELVAALDEWLERSDR